MENTNPHRTSIKVSRRSVFGVILIIAILLLAWLSFGGRHSGWMNSTGVGGMVSVEDSRNIDMGNMSSMPPMYDETYPYPNPQNDASYKDNREFLKTNYNAQIRTRNVRDVVRDIKGAVRDAEGRVDGTTSGEQNGYVSFVVPKARYDAFKDEVESLVHKKLITVTESSVNLLGQKQSIEQQAEDIATSLAGLTKAKADLIARHKQTLAALATDIAANQSNPTQTSLLEEKKAAENASYAAQVKSYDSKIAAAKAKQDANVKQDEQFTDNVETVNGYISVNHVSLWQMAKIFSPIHPTIIVIVLLIVIWYWLNKKEYIPKVVLI